MAKYKEKILKNLFILYLVLFPFGQLLHDFYVADLLVLIIGVFTLFDKKLFEPKGKFLSLVMIGSFSLVGSLAFFEIPQIFVGTLYFGRLVCYVLLFFFISKTYIKISEKESIYKKLLVVNFFIVLFGILQYVFFPDVRFLKEFGWDDHYFRLVSTFLDPTFTGIIMLFGLILSLDWFFRKRELRYFALAILNLFAIALTYSRSTYLALVVTTIYLFFLTRKKVILLFPIVLLVAIPFLPRPSSEGVKLERTYSIFQKVDDYNKAWVIFLKSPVYGIGFNNICEVKGRLFNESKYMSHSCNGIDNGILFIASTAGVIGLIFFFEILTRVNFRSLSGVLILAALIHGMFANTLFYSFVMGMLAIVLSITSSSDYNYYENDRRRKSS